MHHNSFSRVTFLLATEQVRPGRPIQLLKSSRVGWGSTLAVAIWCCRSIGLPRFRGAAQGLLPFSAAFLLRFSRAVSITDKYYRRKRENQTIDTCGECDCGINRMLCRELRLHTALYEDVGRGEDPLRFPT